MVIDCVITRITKKGLNIPEDVINRSYYKGMQNRTEIFIDIYDY